MNKEYLATQAPPACIVGPSGAPLCLRKSIIIVESHNPRVHLAASKHSGWPIYVDSYGFLWIPVFLVGQIFVAHFHSAGPNQFWTPYSFLPSKTQNASKCNSWIKYFVFVKLPRLRSYFHLWSRQPSLFHDRREGTLKLSLAILTLPDMIPWFAWLSRFVSKASNIHINCNFR